MRGEEGIRLPSSAWNKSDTTFQLSQELQLGQRLESGLMRQCRLVTFFLFQVFPKAQAFATLSAIWVMVGRWYETRVGLLFCLRTLLRDQLSDYRLEGLQSSPRSAELRLES